MSRLRWGLFYGYQFYSDPREPWPHTYPDEESAKKDIRNPSFVARPIRVSVRLEEL